MKKDEFITRVADKAGMTKGEANKALDAIAETITEVASAEDKIAIAGFGTFEGKMREARQARNPATGGTVDVPAKRVMKFKPSSSLEL